MYPLGELGMRQSRIDLALTVFNFLRLGRSQWVIRIANTEGVTGEADERSW